MHVIPPLLETTSAKRYNQLTKLLLSKYRVPFLCCFNYMQRKVQRKYAVIAIWVDKRNLNAPVGVIPGMAGVVL